MTTRRPSLSYFHRPTHGIAAAGLAVALLTGAGSAAAVSTLPDALFEVSIGGTTTDYATPGDYAAGSAHVTTGNLPSPSVSASVATAGVDDARGWMRYSWQLNGPDGAMVPILIVGNLGVASSAPDNGQANAVAALTVSTGLFTDSAFLEIDRGGFNNAAPTSAHPSFSHLLLTGTGGSVTLDASVGGRGGSHGGASAYALADPVFMIDPSFAATDPNYMSHYSFTFSPGVGNSFAPSAVPEPQSGVLLLAGLGVVASLRRRRG